MIDRYTRPAFRALWSDENRFRCWLEIEATASEALADAGIVPHEAARAIRERGAFTVERIREIEQVTRHDVIAFLNRAGSTSASPPPTSSTPRKRFSFAKPPTASWPA